MKIKRGDIIVSSIGGIHGKPRPFIVIQANIFNDNLFTVLVAPLTTNIRIESEDFRPVIRPSINNQLEYISQIMLDRMTTIQKKDIDKIIGEISKKELSNISSAILLICGI